MLATKVYVCKPRDPEAKIRALSDYDSALGLNTT
jgi:hypothetical protein